LKVAIGPDGTARMIYTEELELDSIGAQEIRRASHVEPSPYGWGWTADLDPVGGPVLGPFPTRSAALTAEIEWIEANAL
jgi:hypothetical protein